MIRFVSLNRQRMRLARGSLSWLILLAVLVTSTEFVLCDRGNPRVKVVEHVQVDQHGHSNPPGHSFNHGKHCVMCVVPALLALNDEFDLIERLTATPLHQKPMLIRLFQGHAGTVQARAPPSNGSALKSA
jgi:hypothetical protein